MCNIKERIQAAWRAFKAFEAPPVESPESVSEEKYESPEECPISHICIECMGTGEGAKYYVDDDGTCNECNGTGSVTLGGSKEDVKPDDSPLPWETPQNSWRAYQAQCKEFEERKRTEKYKALSPVCVRVEFPEPPLEVTDEYTILTEMGWTYDCLNSSNGETYYDEFTHPRYGRLAFIADFVPSGEVVSEEELQWAESMHPYREYLNWFYMPDGDNTGRITCGEEQKSSPWYPALMGLKEMLRTIEETYDSFFSKDKPKEEEKIITSAPNLTGDTNIYGAPFEAKTAAQRNAIAAFKASHIPVKKARKPRRKK